MRRNDVIAAMLDLHRRLQTLPPPRPRGFYTAAELADVLGRRPSCADGATLRNLGWLRTVRVFKGRAARVWIPPSHAEMIFNSTPT